MKSFKITGRNEGRVEIAEKIENIEINDNETAEELCEVVSGCSGYDIPYYRNGEEERTAGDYILENGLIIGDETHSGEGKKIGSLDIEKTNELMRKNGDADFAYWCFDLWVGSYWDGNNWKIVAVEK